MSPDTPTYGPDRQAEVSLSGLLEDESPEFPVTDEDLVERAREEPSEEGCRSTLRRAER
ncbi:isopentenyl-diphosphate delta-isomerase [Natrinema marinum]|uniref:isopentenyl-diphosphate delta-isomerase n=1 Tax=Natrinema marinum TaxID=2961598 RepID=UPI0020C8468B|nr:isopentenyl-diphosphate delta-isomerase [Natrinema marinum]